MSDALLTVTGLHKHFGGIYATENVNLDVEAGRIPNNQTGALQRSRCFQSSG